MNKNNLGIAGLAAIVALNGLSGCGTSSIRSNTQETIRNNAYVLSQADKYKSGVDLLKAAGECKCVEGFALPPHYYNQPIETKTVIIGDVMSRYTAEQLAGISTRYMEKLALGNMNAWYADATQKDLVSTIVWASILSYSRGKAAGQRSSNGSIGQGSSNNVGSTVISNTVTPVAPVPAPWMP